MTIHIKKNGQQHQSLTIDKVNVRPKTPSTNNEELPPGRGPEDVWNSVLRTALLLPGAKVDRKAFLRKALSKHVTEKVLQSAMTPPLQRQASARTRFGISPPQTSNGIAQASALYHSHPDSRAVGGLQAQSQLI
jgi:hypothetical protein